MAVESPSTKYQCTATGTTCNRALYAAAWSAWGRRQRLAGGFSVGLYACWISRPESSPPNQSCPPVADETGIQRLLASENCAAKQ